MSAIGLLPQQRPSVPIGALLLEALTWVGLVGTVSTMSWSGDGSSLFAIAVALAGTAVSLIRRFPARRLTGFAVWVELLTLFLVIGVVNNPGQRGMPAVVGALAVWVLIEATRHLLRPETTLFTQAGRFLLLIPVALLIDGRTWYGVPTPAILAAWAALEVGWTLIDARLLRDTRLPYSLTRRQKRGAIAAGIVLIGLLLASAVFNITTVRYYDQTMSPYTLHAMNKSLHCVQESWIFAGLDLSWVGFNPMRCYDTQTEADEAIRQRHPGA